MASLAKRIINTTFVLDAASGTFDASGSNTASFKGLRTSVNITYQTGGAFAELDMKIFGMPLEAMNKLTILQNAYNANVHNSVQVEAGDTQNGVSVAFSGGIQECWVDASGAPEVALIVKGFASLSSAFAPVAPISYDGSIDIGTAASAIAQQLNPPCTLENSGVTGQVRDQYLHGDAMSQLRDLARLGNFDYVIEGGDPYSTLAIWPKGLARGAQAVDISVDTDLIGYPSFTQSGVMFATLYNPNAKVGVPVNLKSKFLTPANGQWCPSTIGHDLESETIGGKWETHFEATVFGRSIYSGQ